MNATAICAIALPILAASFMLATGCQDANEGTQPDLKATPEPGKKTTFSSYGEAMQDKAKLAAKDKEAAKAAPAKTPQDSANRDCVLRYGSFAKKRAGRSIMKSRSARSVQVVC